MGVRTPRSTVETKTVFQVSFLPYRGSNSSCGVGDFDEDATLEHRKLQRTPTPYYEDPPSLMVADTLNLDDMDATDSVPQDVDVTEASGTTGRDTGTFSYDGDDDDDDDEEDICRELAQLN